MSTRDPNIRSDTRSGPARRISLLVFVAVVAGALALRVTFDGWQAQHTGELILLLAVTGLLCGPLAPLSTEQSEILLRTPLSLLSLSILGVPEAILVLGTGRLLQSLHDSQASRSSVMLHSSVGILTALAGGAAYQARWVRHISANPIIWVFFASLTYFTVEALVSLGERLLNRTPAEPSDPLYPYPEWLAEHLASACCAVAMIAITKAMGWESLFLLLPTLVMLYWALHRFRGRLDRQTQQATAAVDLHLRTIQALALAIEAKDANAKDHLKRMRLYAVEIARRLCLGEKESQAVEAAALLHDVGKLGVPEYIFSKPGTLTAEEFERMRIHPQVGAEILETVGFPYPVVPIVRAHHEFWNGSGYPNGLRGTEIPVGARILAVVDCFDGFVTERPHRPALSMPEALQRIRQQAGIRFDPDVVDALERCCAETERRVQANTELTKRSARPASSGDFTEVIASTTREIHTLLKLNSNLGNSLILEDTFAILEKQIRQSLTFDSLALYWLRDDRLTPVYANGVGARLLSALSIEPGQGLSGWVVENGKPILNGRPETEFGLAFGPVRTSYLRSALAIPLRGSNKITGCLTLYSKEPAAFTNDHLRLLLAVSEKMGLAIENALRFREEQTTAATDGLTNLPNSRALFAELNKSIEDCRQTGGTLAVLVTDLDSFKRVNDELGHVEGNRLLQRVAEGMRSVCRPSDYVARMGGDEFVILMRNTPMVAADSAVKALQEMVAREAQLVTRQNWVSLSVGMSLYPLDGSTPDVLLTEADRRMYEMKSGHHALREQLAAVQLTLALSDQIR